MKKKDKLNCLIRPSKLDGLSLIRIYFIILSKLF